MKELFTAEERAHIREAVAAAEVRTSGEIVPYVVGKCDEYEVGIWRGAGFFSVGALLVVILVFQFYTGWGLAWLHTGWGTALFVLLAGTTGALLAATVSPFKRALIGDNILTARTHARAMQAFVEEEVFNTTDRTGILLFIALFEHRIEVFGDRGINQKVTSEDWAEVVERIRRGIREDNFARGMIEAIHLCGELLEQSGVAPRADNQNELPNTVRLKPR